MMSRVYLEFYAVARKDVGKIIPVIKYTMSKQSRFRRRRFSTFRTLLASNNDSDEFSQIKQSIKSLCAKFPGRYWQSLETNSQYPIEFVHAMQESGFLSGYILSGYIEIGLK